MVIQKSLIARFQAAWNLALWQPILMLSMTLDAFLNYGAACNWQTLMLRAYWHTKVAKYFIRKNGSSPNYLYWNQKSYHFGDSSLTKFGGLFCLWTSSPPNGHDFCFQYWWFVPWAISTNEDISNFFLSVNTSWNLQQMCVKSWFIWHKILSDQIYLGHILMHSPFL